MISNTFELESEAPEITLYAERPRQSPPRRADINPQQLVPKPRRKIELQAKVTSDRAAAFQILPAGYCVVVSLAGTDLK